MDRFLDREFHRHRRHLHLFGARRRASVSDLYVCLLLPGRIENTFDPESTPMRKSGLGLKNVRERLDARYGKEANMRVSAENGTFRVELSFPADTEEVQS